MISRRPDAAASEEYDLIVVGGGVYGAALTLEAARRGVKSLLLERGDFGCGTSWNSLRIVHGGFRYLQSLDIVRYRESVRERSWFLENFPDLVRPLECVMPLYNRGVRRKALFRLAGWTNDALSALLGAGPGSRRGVPRGSVLDANETARIFPAVNRDGLVGGGVWHDASMARSQRLIIEMIHWAVCCGATAVNHVEATGVACGVRDVTGVEARDRISGDALHFRASQVVNCCGPGARDFIRSAGIDEPPLFRPSIAFNVLLDCKPPSRAAVALTIDGDGRDAGGGSKTYLLHPLGDLTLAGTSHAPASDDESPSAIDPSLVTRFIEELNRAAPALELREESVLRVHWGLLPVTRSSSVDLVTRACIVDHRRHGGPRGLISVSGVKFTMARRVAEQTLALVQGGNAPRRSTPRPSPRSIVSVSEFMDLLDRDRTSAEAIVKSITQEESVINIEDLLLRRTDWGIDPREAARLGSEIAHLVR